MNTLHIILIVVALLLLALTVFGALSFINEETEVDPTDAAVVLFLGGFFAALILVASPITTLGIVAVTGLALTVARTVLSINQPPQFRSPGNALLDITLTVVVALALLGV